MCGTHGYLMGYKQVISVLFPEAELTDYGYFAAATCKYTLKGSNPAIGYFICTCILQPLSVLSVGDQARSMLIQSGLSQGILAQIWLVHL